MASIRKLPSGRWQAVIYVGRDENGKMLRKYVTKDTMKECKTAAREVERKVEENDISNVSMMKMDKYMDKWLELNKPHLASTTIKAYSMYIENHFKPAFRDLKVYQITDMHIKSYIADKMKGLSSTTVRKHFFTLRKIFREAMKHKSPCLGIKAPEINEYKPKVPTEEEFEKIRETFKNIGIEGEIIILLAGWCGLRRGEIFALKWDDIDMKKGFIRIDEALALKEDSYKFEFKKPKSKNSVRSIVAPDYLIDRLKHLKKEQFSNNKVVKIKKEEIEKSKIFSIMPGAFSSKYKKIIKKNNLPNVRFHDLRHYHASFLYENNVPDLYAAERLGHDIWVLKKIYQHLGLKKKKQLDKKIKKFFK